MPAPATPARSREPTFEQLAVRADDEIDLALGAALIARDVDPEVDPRAVVAQLDVLAAPLTSLDLARVSPLKQVEAVTARFCDLGFRGNVDDYYDPKNSLLSDVLERRVGIPITLSIVWCELARRAGVPAAGVGFPGHFLARVESVIVDPFAGGRVVDEAAARELLRRALGDGAELHPSLFAPASPRAILVRLLSNLKAIWANRGNHTRAFVAVDRLVTLEPHNARILRERAGVALRLGITELARADFTRVLELEPRAPDAPVIRKRLSELARTPTMPN